MNKNVRGIKRSKALTNQQIADANTDMTADDVQDGTGTDAVLPALKVNSDITKWAQTRADELAAKDDITHANMYNGVPEWATFTRNGYRFPSTFNSPNYVGGKQAFGPEALAIWTTGSGANPIDMWASELDTAEEGYGHYLTEISQLANVAGMGVAQTAGGNTIAVLEIAYDDGEGDHGTTQTVDEALKALQGDSAIASVTAPDSISIAAGTDPTDQLPATVKATTEDGETKDVAVTWAKVSADEYSKANSTFTVHGTIAGYDEGVDITINVGAAAPVSAANPTESVRTIEGNVPDLSSLKSKVTWSNGTTTDKSISWDMPEASAFTAPGPVTVNGTVTVDGKTFNVSTSVAVDARTITNVTLSNDAVTVPSGTDPKSELDKITAAATWNDGATSTETVTWNAVSKDDYAAREGKTITVQGTIKGYSKNVIATVTVTPATITKVNANQDVSVEVDGALNLPTTVGVDYSNGEQNVAAQVTWDQSAVDTSKVGDYTVNGTVAGTSLTTTVTVHVVNATISKVENPTARTVASGTAEDELNLPSTVTATWSNGATSQVAVTWSAPTDADKATLSSRDGGTITLTGSVSDTDIKPTVTITVSKAVATAVALDDQGTTATEVTTENGTAPELQKTAKVTWSNGDVTEETIAWDTITKDQYSNVNGGTFEVTGTVASLPSAKLTATVTYAAAHATSLLNGTVALTVNVGQTPQLPETATVQWDNGVQTEETVTWAEYDKALLEKPGVFTVEGTVTVGPAKLMMRFARMMRAAADTEEAKTFPVTATITVVEPATEPENPGNDGTDNPSNNGNGTSDNDDANQSSENGKKLAQKRAKKLAQTGSSLLGVTVALVALLAAGGVSLVMSRKKNAE